MGSDKLGIIITAIGFLWGLNEIGSVYLIFRYFSFTKHLVSIYCLPCPVLAGDMGNPQGASVTHALLCTVTKQYSIIG